MNPCITHHSAQLSEFNSNVHKFLALIEDGLRYGHIGSDQDSHSLLRVALLRAYVLHSQEIAAQFGEDINTQGENWQKPQGDPLARLLAPSTLKALCMQPSKTISKRVELVRNSLGTGRSAATLA